MKRKIIPMAKREPTEKERHLSELIKSVEELQGVLASINRSGDLWEIFNCLMLFMGDCMRESGERLSKTGKERR